MRAGRRCWARFANWAIFRHGYWLEIREAGDDREESCTGRVDRLIVDPGSRMANRR
jgi:hypothetical protein